MGRGLWDLLAEGKLPNFAATTGTDGDVSGNRIPDTPKQSVVFGFEASVMTGPTGRAFLRSDVAWEDRRYNNASNLNVFADLRDQSLASRLDGVTTFVGGS